MSTRSKTELINLINNKYDVKALLEYSLSYYTIKQDQIFLLNTFKMFEENKDIKKGLNFYQDYIRTLTNSLRDKTLETNPENIKKVEKLISMTMEANESLRPTYLYSARFYKLMYERKISGYTNIKDQIINLYEKAEKLGSTNAKSEKETFLTREKHISYDLNYYNANHDLEALIDQISNNAQDENFSILLYGPINSGMYEFAGKLYATLNMSFKTVSAANLASRGNLAHALHDNINNHLIFHEIDTCFNIYNRFDDAKDFIFQSNSENLINRIKENKRSNILIINDINKLPKTLLNAFPIRIKFDYMNRAQKNLALQNVLGIPVSNQLDNVQGLVYNDFLRVKTKMMWFNISDEHSIINMIKEEATINMRLTADREKHKAYNLDYYNADYNLSDLMQQILFNKGEENFSILIHGPENSGRKEFAYKLFANIDKTYDSITASNLEGRSSLTKCLQSNFFDNLVLHNIDTCFNLYHRFEDDKDYAYQSNTEYLIRQIREKNKSFILIVNDIDKLPQILVDAFPLKVKFDYMNKAQKQAALQNIFGIYSSKLDNVNGLVYDDFLRIKEKAILLNISDENNIIDMLNDEASKKPSFLTYTTPISFFDINLVNANTNLVNLTEKLEKITQPFTMLISGPAGTGKSYYLRYLAHKMGKNVLEKTAAELFSKYQGEPAKNVLKLFKEAEEQNAVVILDEVERITGKRENDFSNGNQWKSDMTNAFLTCLENTKCPFMATTNFVSDIDKAILRRFIFKINFDYLTPEQVGYAFRYNFNMEAPSELFKIGGLTNGDFAVVKKKAQILNIEDKFELCEMLKEETAIKATGRITYIEQPINFDKNFINIEGKSLELYVKNLKEEQTHNFSILLHGPSGTGKSLYLRNLAKELGYEVIERRASDIISKWLGEAEKNIAEAFEEAKNRRAMLIFDEIDTFLPNKANLSQAYDVRITNEFLVQLENHPYPVCATTNYLDNLEYASIRRFKINAKFDYLRKDQYNYVYRKTFGVEPLKDITSLTNLTPAIFALAAEKVSLAEVETDQKRIFEIFMEDVKHCTGINNMEEDKTYETLTIKPQKLYETPISDNYDKILAGFVKIITDTGHGSGFFITDDGFILTNKHVVKEQNIVKVELFSGRHVPGEVIRINNLDIALIKISSENKMIPLPIRTSELNIGSVAFSFGNPGTKNQVLSKGCITRYTRTKNAQRIETDCFMDNGSSGGPLLDEFGNVIGVNVEGWLVKNTKLSLGLNLHLSINDALSSLNIKIKSVN